MLLNFDYLKRAFELDVTGVLHIGAHYGQEFQLYQKHGIKNLVFFEPLSDNFAKLKSNVAETETVKLINKALGNKNQKVQMHVEVANQGQSSSILKPDLHLKQYPHITFDNVETVEMVRLDDLREILDASVYNMINMDVQGYELEVLKGANHFLSYVDYIFTEVNRAQLYEGNALVEELDDFLKDRRFSRIATDWEGKTWGDALYVKDQD